LRQGNESLSDSTEVEKKTKDKYFQMWRQSEKEKDRLKTSKFVYHGYGLSRQSCSNDKATEILQIDHSLLRDIKENIGELGNGKFGTVFIKQFRSSPVAVKYFDPTTSANQVEREASFLKKICHINLPIIFGMNNNQKPFFIATEFYGSNNFQASTLRSVIKNSDLSECISGPEHWLHIITQLADSVSYLHSKEIIHNDIKSDNVMIVSNSSVLSPVLIDFGKTCLVSEGKKKILSQAEKSKYYKDHFHIAPEVIEGLCPQTIKSDVFSLGVLVASVYRHTKYKPLKEVARQALKPFQTRCTSSELLTITQNLVK
jgi:serine/threonine protein kinase